MKNILYIIILNLCFAKNFIYTEDSWYSVLSPRNITSISCNYNEIFFSSTNGLFIYNKDNKDFYYSDYILGNLDNKKIHIIHYDLYRDNIWVLNPFSGLGDVGVACKKNGRRFIGFETNKDYLLLSMKRIDNS